MDHPNPMLRVGEQTESAGDARARADADDVALVRARADADAKRDYPTSDAADTPPPPLLARPGALVASSASLAREDSDWTPTPRLELTRKLSDHGREMLREALGYRPRADFVLFCTRWLFRF